MFENQPDQEKIFQSRSVAELNSLEEKYLKPYATLNRQWQDSRRYPEAPHRYRTAFQRDRDRIIHSRAFRRLKHKRQVFVVTVGDHYRTRITHTMEVSQLSRTIGKAIGLNEELVEAISLGHDLGHTPFGHVGEFILNKILNGSDLLDGLMPGINAGGFKHNIQSIRVVDQIETRYEWPGLNLTMPVREGILKHTRFLRGIIEYPDFFYDDLHYELDNATTLEGQVVAIADEIAQRTHDLEDGVRAGYVELEQVREILLLNQVEKSLQLADLLGQDRYLYRNRLIVGLIDFLVSDVIETTLKNVRKFYHETGRMAFFDRRIVWFSDAVDPLQEKLDAFIHKEIIARAATDRLDQQARILLRELFKIYYQNPGAIPRYRLRDCCTEAQIQRILAANHDTIPEIAALHQGQMYPKFVRCLADHIANMTDNFAMLEADRFQIDLKDTR